MKVLLFLSIVASVALLVSARCPSSPRWARQFSDRYWCAIKRRPGRVPNSRHRANLGYWSKMFEHRHNKMKRGPWNRNRLPSGVYAPIDGRGHNPDHPSWGAADVDLVRVGGAFYRDNMAGVVDNRPNPRAVSNSVFAQEESIPSRTGLSDLFWQWGQFLDHDITETKGSDENLNIAIPKGDKFMDPKSLGNKTMAFRRSFRRVDSNNVPQQVNVITSWIDASMVYGSEEEVAERLRAHKDGLMKVSQSRNGDLLPINSEGMFEGGDVRANEQSGLTSMHTLWVREHNRIAKNMKRAYPHWNDEQIYQKSRKLVMAEVQSITYYEFVPRLLGPKAWRSLGGAYRGYNNQVNPTITNEFATAAFRFGHSMLSSVIPRINKDGDHPAGPLSLADAFFKPEHIKEHGIDAIIRGQASQTAQNLDNFLVNEIRNMLFGQPGDGGLDLGALNVQRGRDHGLPSLVQMRFALGIDRKPVINWNQIKWASPAVQKALESVYKTVDKVDLWAGGLCEKTFGDSLVGPTFWRILADQFQALRDGDRFYFERSFSPAGVRSLRATKLHHIIMRNTDVNIRGSAFQASSTRVDRIKRSLPHHLRNKSKSFYQTVCTLVNRITNKYCTRPTWVCDKFGGWLRTMRFRFCYLARAVV